MKTSLIVVIDNPGWAIGNFALDVKKFCSDAFDVQIVPRRSLRRIKADVALVPSIGLLPIPFPAQRTIVCAASWTWTSSSRHARKTFAVLGMNQALCTEWRRVHRQVIYFPSVVDLDLFYPREVPRDDVQTVFGIAGTLRRPEKGFDLVVQAFNLATKKRNSAAEKNLRLRFCGTGYKNVLLPREKMREEFYHQIDAYVMASSREGGPNTLVEAMACGVPCVATRAGLAPEIITNGENGWLIDRSPESIANRMLRLLDQRARLREVGERARRTALGLGWQEWKKELVRVVRAAAKK